MVNLYHEAKGQSVSADQRHAQTTMCRIPAAGNARCSQLSSSYQVRQHELPFPVPIMVKITPTEQLSFSWAGQDANQGQHSSFLPHLSVPPPPRKHRCTVHSHPCGHGGTCNRPYVTLALFSLLATCVVFWSHRRRDIGYTAVIFLPERMYITLDSSASTSYPSL